MSLSPDPRRDLTQLRADLDGLSVETKLLRIGWLLSRKYDPDQPREPAGQPGGGRWTSDGSTDAGLPSGRDDPETTGSIGGGDPAASTTQEEVVTADGSRVLTIRIRANRQTDWDEQHTVTAPDGTRTVFETSGLTQTIRDGESGEILGRSTLTKAGAEPEPFLQAARGPGSARAKAASEAALTLFTWLSDKNSRDRTAVFTAPASEYVPGDAYNDRAMWVGAVSQSELDQLCPRNREVQALADDAAADIRAAGNYMGEQDFGNKVHAVIAKKVRDRHDPDFVAETSYLPFPEPGVRYGAKGTIRLDVLEKNLPLTVCVYDHKAGQAGLRAPRAIDIITVIQRHYPGTIRYIMIEIRPRS